MGPGEPVRITIKHPGVLGAFGYLDVARLTVTQRRAALRRAAKALGWLYLVRKLNALYVFNKRRHVELAAAFKADREYASARHKADKARADKAPHGHIRRSTTGRRQAKSAR